MAYDKETWRASVENGKIPRGKLAIIMPPQYDPDLDAPGMMHPEAASAMTALLHSAHDYGASYLATRYTYRTLAKQWEKWESYQAGGNLAAYPGTSNHGWAVAVDFTGLTSMSLAWLKGNAHRYGFINDVPSENWHYTYQGGWTDEEDPMTPEQIASLKESERRWEGAMAYLEASVTDPRADPPVGKPKAWKEGWRYTRAILNR